MVIVDDQAASPIDVASSSLHDSVANLRATLQLPSLEAVFAALVAEENVDARSRGLVDAMKAGIAPE